MRSTIEMDKYNSDMVNDSAARVGSLRVEGNTLAHGADDPRLLPVSRIRLTSPSFARRRLLN